MQWQGCAQTGSLPTAQWGHQESGFTFPSDVGQTEQHSLLSLGLGCITLEVISQPCFLFMYSVQFWDLGGGLKDGLEKWRLLKHILIQFTCNEFVDANFKQLQKHEIKQWKTDLQRAQNRESPEGRRPGPQLPKSFMGIVPCAKLHYAYRTIYEDSCGLWDLFCQAMTQATSS